MTLLPHHSRVIAILATMLLFSLSGCQWGTRSPREVTFSDPSTVRSPHRQRSSQVTARDAARDPTPFHDSRVQPASFVSSENTDRVAHERRTAGRTPAIGYLNNLDPGPTVFERETDQRASELDITTTPVVSMKQVPMTLEDFENLALENHPGLFELQSRADAARGRAYQAGVPPNFVIGYSGQQLFSSGQAEQHGVFLGRQYIRGGKLSLSQSVLLQKVEEIELQRLELQHRTVTDVRLGFYQVLTEQKRVEIHQVLLETANQVVKAVNVLLMAQDVSGVDLMRAEIELKAARMNLTAAESSLRNAWNHLAILSGVPDMPSQWLDGELEIPLERLQLPEIRDRLLNESPQMMVAMAKVETARRQISREFAELTPDLDVQAVLQHDNGTGSANANLQVSIPIPWTNQNDGGIRAARSSLTAESQAVERLGLALEQRLNESYRDYSAASERVAGYANPEGILAQTKETLDLVREGYESGEFDYVDLLAAQETFSQTNLDYLDALDDMWKSYIRIEGLLLTGSLGWSPDN